MEDNNLLKEIQEDYRNPKKKRAKRESKPKKKERNIGKTIRNSAFAILIVLIGVAYCAEKYVDWRAGHQWQFPLVWIGLVREIGDGQEILSPVVETKEEPEKITQSWTGKVSWYGHGEGCMGCDPNEIMANGQKFDENAMTLAFNLLPLNTRVRVTNLDNGANAIATVTDTGGFEQYGRIADLSKGLMTELNAITDVSNIKIETL